MIWLVEKILYITTCECIRALYHKYEVQPDIHLVLKLCAGKDSNLRRPKPTGLQPVVIDHSTTDAFLFCTTLSPINQDCLVKC